MASGVFNHGCGISQYNRDFLMGLDACDKVSLVNLLVRLPPKTTEGLNYSKKIKLSRQSYRGKISFFVESLKFLSIFRKVDLIICAHVNLLPIAYFMAKLKKATLCLIIYGEEVWDTHEKFIYRALIKRINFLISISNYTKNKFCQWAGEKKGYILNNPIDLQRFTMGTKNISLMKRYGVAYHQKVIISLCRLASCHQYKGIDQVIDVFNKLLCKNKNILYLVAGEGDDRKRLEAKVKKNNLANYIKFIGFLPESEKVDFYRLADVFAMPGRGEGFGYVYLEAIACGVTTIGSTLDASREALQEGRLGFLVNPDNQEELIEAIQAALLQNNKRPEGIYRFANKNFYISVNKIMRDIYQSI